MKKVEAVQCGSSGKWSVVKRLWKLITLNIIEDYEVRSSVPTVPRRYIIDPNNFRVQRARMPEDGLVTSQPVVVCGFNNYTSLYVCTCEVPSPLCLSLEVWEHAVER